MGIFSDAFRPMVKNTTSSLKSVIAGVPGSVILESINKYRDYLKTNSGVVDTFISAVTMTSELMCDSVTQGTMAFTGAINDFAAVPTDLAQILIQGFVELCHAGKNELSMAGVTLTDSAGRAYNIIDYRSRELVIDGKTVLFSMNNEIVDISDAIIYSDAEGHMYINNFIKTANFVREGQERERPDNIQDILFATNIIAGKDTSDNTISGLLSAYTDKPVFSIMDFINDEWPGQYQNILDCAEDLWITENLAHPLPEAAGHINSLWNVTSDIIESSALNSVICSACEAVIGGINSGVAITAVFQQCLSSKYKSIQNFGAGLANAFNKGGVYGVGTYVLSYVKDLCNARVEDGVLQFTDNSRLAPRIYIAGLLQTIATSITTILSLMVSLFSRIAGAALAIVGTVASQLFAAIEYDYSSTNAAINSSDKVVIPISPYGLCQTEVPYSRTVIGDELYALFEQGETLMYAAIPGAYVLIGPGEFDDQGHITKVRFELHPSLHDGRACFEYIAYELNSHHWARYSKVSPQVRMYLRVPQLNRDQFAKKILQKYSELISDYSIENQSNDHLSDSDDAFMREVIMKNLFIAGVYLSCALDYEFMNALEVSVTGVGTVSSPSTYSYALPNLGSGGTMTSCFWYAFLAYQNKVEIMCDDDSPYPGGFFTFDQSRGSISDSWLNIYDHAVRLLAEFSPNNTNLSSIFNDYNDYPLNSQRYYDSAVTFSGTLEDGIYIPEYDRQSFWKNVIASAVVTVLIATTVAITVFAAKKAINKRRAYNQARVEAAHQAFVDNPSSESYAEYVSAVKKNNVWSSLIGGTKYDYVNYWNGDPAADTQTGSTSGSVVNNLAAGASLLGGSKNPDINSPVNLNGANISVADEKLYTIIRLLRG